MANDIGRIVGEAAAARFVGRAGKASANHVQEYRDFLSTIGGDSQKAFDQYVLGQSPELAKELGIPEKIARAEKDAKTSALWNRYFSTNENRIALFQKYFGAEVVDQVRDSAKGEPRSYGSKENDWAFRLDATLEVGDDGVAKAKLHAWVPGPPDPRGFDVLITKTVASGEITFAPDGSVADFSRS